MSPPVGNRSATSARSRGSGASPSRRPTPTSGSAPIPTDTSRRPGATREAGSSTAIIRGGGRCGTRPSSAGCWPSARCCPTVRAKVERDLARPGLPREKVLATVVRLLECTGIRVGNDEYAKANRSFGLTTLQDQHVEVSGSTLRFEFRGKSGKTHDVALSDRRLARIVRRCQALPGEDLFQYVDDEGNRQTIGSGDVNDYLREITGQEFTAKDFRTWAGTLLAVAALRELGPHRRRAAGQVDHPQGDRSGRRAAQQHPRGVPEVLRPPGGLRDLHHRIVAGLARQRKRGRQAQGADRRRAGVGTPAPEGRLTQAGSSRGCRQGCLRHHPRHPSLRFRRPRHSPRRSCRRQGRHECCSGRG